MRDTRETTNDADANEQSAAELEAIAFVGETLAPFFLQDPRTGTADASFDAVAALDTQEAASAWPFADAEEAQRAFALMVDGLAKGRDDDLVWEYRRLFIGPAPKPAPPWGSVYTDRECVVFGATTLELRAWMRAHGVQRASDERTPEDHIGLMLGLMAYLARTQPGDLDEFLRLHLLPWSSHLLSALEGAAEHPFYEGLALLANSSLEGIRQVRELDVVQPRFYR